MSRRVSITDALIPGPAEDIWFIARNAPACRISDRRMPMDAAAYVRLRGWRKRSPDGQCTMPTQSKTRASYMQ